MASAGDEEVEYESDPEEERRLMSMRRRQAASDDEEGDDRTAEVSEDDESDGQGGFEEYDENDDDEEYEEDEGEEVHVGDEGKAAEEETSRDGDVGLKEANGDPVDGGEVKNEEKEKEPFAVPTAGAFYMHDDRFRDNAANRGRRMRGGRRLWESRDDSKWGHDKFEEMTTQERQYVERRGTGRYRGRGKSRGTGRGDTRGSRSRAYNNINDQNQAPKSVRGRGSRRYEQTGNNNNHVLSTQNRQSGKSNEKNVRTSSGTAFTAASNVGSDQGPARKQAFASSLNYASPPFYPSGSSGKDISMTQRDMQPANNNRNLRPDAISDKITSAQNDAWMRGKNVADSVRMESLNINDSANRAAGNTVPNLQMQPSGSSAATYSQSSQSRFQGRGNTGQMTYRPAQLQNQARRGSTSSGIHVQNWVQTPEQIGQVPVSGSQTSSPPKSVPSVNEASVAESASELNKSKKGVVGKRNSSQGSGGGSFQYTGAPITGMGGNMSVGHGDQNFSAAPTFLPVMQFGGQHPGGMGVPAYGMAFPGYVGGNSEMTWLPVLAGAAGAIGGAYCPPQIAVDSSYNPHPGQTSSTGSSNKESNTSKPNNELNTSERDESATEEVVRRQNKPRRYSEMNFGQ